MSRDHAKSGFHKTISSDQGERYDIMLKRSNNISQVAESLENFDVLQLPLKQSSRRKPRR